MFRDLTCPSILCLAFVLSACAAGPGEVSFASADTTARLEHAEFVWTPPGEDRPGHVVVLLTDAPSFCDATADVYRAAEATWSAGCEARCEAMATAADGRLPETVTTAWINGRLESDEPVGTLQQASTEVVRMDFAALADLDLCVSRCSGSDRSDSEVVLTEGDGEDVIELGGLEDDGRLSGSVEVDWPGASAAGDFAAGPCASLVY